MRIISPKLFTYLLTDDSEMHTCNQNNIVWSILKAHSYSSNEYEWSYGVSNTMYIPHKLE